MRRAVWGVLVCCLLAGCLASLDPLPTAIVTATPDPIDLLASAGTPSALPPLMVAGQLNPEASPTPVFITPVPTEAPPCEIPIETRPRYVVSATLNWAERRVDAEQQLTYVNTTGVSLERLALHVEPNYQPGFFVLHGVQDADYQDIDGVNLEVTRLTVPLPQTLPPNCAVTLILVYTIRIPPVLDGYFGRVGYLGFTERQINLGHWMPVVGQFVEDWQTPQPYFLGEQTFTLTSDFEVNLTVNDAPPTIDIAAPGQVRVLGENAWQFTLLGGRDFSLSIGNGFRRTSQLASDGTVIELYYYPTSSTLNPAGQALKAAAEALVLYEELFGLPYPYKRLVIVEGDFPDGMEFSGLVFVGEAWFRGWRGEPNEWLTIITVHEVAHQWWYAMVGNDPAIYPYLDEAFATYSEYLYFQRYYGDLTEWWWDFRVRGYDRESSPVDANIYRYDNARPYINGAYLRGAEMLHRLRDDLGDEAFFDWLRRYALANLYEIAEPADLWGALSPEQYAASLPVRQQFLGKWGVLPEIE